MDAKAPLLQGFRQRKSPRWMTLDFKMVPPIGFELMTYRLQGGCSTN